MHAKYMQTLQTHTYTYTKIYTHSHTDRQQVEAGHKQTRAQADKGVSKVVQHYNNLPRLCRLSHNPTHTHTHTQTVTHTDSHSHSHSHAHSHLHVAVCRCRCARRWLFLFK